MDQPKVYVDVTFLVNFTMDYVILWATAKLTGKAADYWRFTIVAILGGIYGVGSLFPHTGIFYSLPAKIIISILFVIVAFPPRTWQEFKETLLVFYGTSFVAAGATIALAYQVKRYNSIGSFSYWWLSAGVICAVLLANQGEKYLSQRLIPALLKYRIELHFGARVCQGEGFLDTGNHLRDPLTKRPVIVAEYSLIKDCIPTDCQAALENFKEQNDLLEALSESSWANRLRLIPFSSIGQKSGMMVGFRCDEIMIDPDQRKVLHKNLVVGIYLDKLANEDDYQLLIPSEILQIA